MAEIDKSLPNVSPTPSDPEFKEQEIALETRDELIPQISNENISFQNTFLPRSILGSLGRVSFGLSLKQQFPN